jgi:hypothetical protein
MRRSLFVLVVLALVGSVGTAQVPREFRPLDVVLEAKQRDEPFPISGCQILWEENERIEALKAQHPEQFMLQKSARAAAWDFKVGDRRDWWATDLNQNSPNYNKEYAVPSTCRAVGVNAYIFVEDDAWNRGRVNQAVVDSVVAAFDLRTPAHPNRGIHRVTTDIFGPAPDIDNDPKIIILILDIRDGWEGSGSFIAGYFAPWNQGPDPTAGRRSNVAEFLYVDCDPLNLTTVAGRSYAGRVVAHEFQHLIHSQYTPELTFVNEGCAMYAEVACGYPIEFQSLYASNPDVYLLGWNGQLADYGRAGYWTLYLAEQFSNNYIRLLTQNRQSGISGINASLAQLTPATPRRFDDIYRDWKRANYLLNRNVDPKYGYTYAGVLNRVSVTDHLSPNVSLQSVSVTGLGADYIRFRSGQSISITFNATSSALGVTALKRSSGGWVVENVPLNTAYSEPTFGSTFSEITFVVTNTTNSSARTSYSYQSSGTGGVTSIELKWDETEPVGFFRLAPLDTMAVLFNAVPGARLDSIRVALRRAGSVQGGVWTAASASSLSPLGTPLIRPITATTTLTPPVVNPGATYPYAVPYPNWRTIDVRSHNLILDQPFAVAFWVPQDTSTHSYVMVTTRQGSASYHNFTYLNNPSSGSPGWYYLGDGNQIWLWLIRAYASTGGSGEFIAPSLIAPHDNATEQPTTITLSWSSVFSATHYRLQVSTQSNLRTLILHDSTITSTSRQLTQLEQGVTYFWRVSARNAEGETPFSVTRRFTTSGLLTIAPIPTGPQQGAINVRSPVAFSWSGIQGATSYHFQLSTSPAFTTFAVNDSMLIVNTKQVGGLKGNTIYYWRVRGRNSFGNGPFSPVRSFTTELSFMLAQNFPNPFNPATTIRYAVPQTGFVTVRVYDVLGREITTLVQQEHSAGVYEVLWNGTDRVGKRVASGLYYYRMEAGPFTETRKMLLTH